MAEPFTSYSLQNDAQFKAGLQRAIDTVSDLRIPFGLILRDFYKSEAAIFKLKGPGKYPVFQNKSGGKVIDGKTPYQRAKIEAVGFDYPLLVRSGALAASLLGPSNKGSISSIGPLSLIFGTSINYAIYHQSDKARFKIPLRKMLFIGPESTFANDEQKGRLTRWLNILNDYVLKKLKTEYPES